jgi:hypothetical protein
MMQLVWSHNHTFTFANFKPLTVMYWIYLLPSTQQTIRCNGFMTCFDSHESSSGYVQNLLVWAVLLLTALEVVGQYEFLRNQCYISACQQYLLFSSWVFWSHHSSMGSVKDRITQHNKVMEYLNSGKNFWSHNIYLVLGLFSSSAKLSGFPYISCQIK